RVDVQPLAGGAGRDAALQIAVKDTGIGISSTQLEKLFVAYQQSEAWIARRFGGTGLGLAISRELARKLGGDISVESTPGVGSIFTVRVATRGPRVTAPPALAAVDAPQSSLPPAEINGKLLLADDGPDNRRLIATVLRKAGALVDVAEN